MDYDKQREVLIKKTKCEHRETRLVSRIYSNNIKHFGQQCQRCGSWVRSVRKATIPKAELLVIPEFDEELTQRWGDHCTELGKDISQLYFKEQEEKNIRWWRNYNKYLSSRRWLDKRQKVLARDDYTCQACHERKATQVHHLDYRYCPVRSNGIIDRSFSEPLFHLISVCSACHDYITEMDRKS